MADSSNSGSRLLLAGAVGCLLLCLLPPILLIAAGSGQGKDLSLFTPSANCVACHNNLVAPSGEDVSIGSTWRSTMMANSARDPYWQASVRRETIDHPTRAAETQDECAACHMPMSRRITREAGGLGDVFAHLQKNGGKEHTALHQLAMDGVSCTTCHQIDADKLGTRENFNANFVMRPTPADGVRQIFGPYQIDAGRRTIMRSVSGFVQAQAPHITESALCATCHTLYTTAFGSSGEAMGSLPEQMNYQEWQHSDFEKEQRSCQSCHMPAVPGPIRISSVLGETRGSLSRHVFVGGNAHMVRLLNRYRHELGVEALPSELEATAQATLRQLQQDTATVAIANAHQEGPRLTFDIDVRNLTGHKFPTGYPSRRAWLHVIVHDAAGRTIFESGAIDDAGVIAGNENDADPRAFEPHYARITRADQVQIYEPILGDREGVPTTGLETATQYLKDNRLLPRGFDKATASPDIAVAGDAARDANFTGDGDRVQYDVQVPMSAGSPLRVEMELRYQAIGYRWAHNLARYNAAEPQRFLSYYQATAANSSVVVAAASYLLPMTN
jgi:hypothetical protein